MRAWAVAPRPTLERNASSAALSASGSEEARRRGVGERVALTGGAARRSARGGARADARGGGAGRAGWRWRSTLWWRGARGLAARGTRAAGKRERRGRETHGLGI
jgi:hypothetical protein